jgi:hypothetical protein
VGVEETPESKYRQNDKAQLPSKRPSATPSNPRRSLPSPLSVIVAALGLFFVVLTLLAIQVRNGRDPALGPGPAIPALNQPATTGNGIQAKAQQQTTQIVTRASPAPPP